MAVINYKGRKLKVDRGVYEPSDDSFLLADNLDIHKGEKILEIGTGCGLLAILAAQEGGEVIATDVSVKALKCAKFNARNHGLDNQIEFRHGDLFVPVKGERFDLIIFNPPYLPVPKSESLGRQLELTWDGGPDGREVIDRFLRKVTDYLKPRGRILLVQSSLSGLDVTLERLRKMKFQTLVKSRNFFYERIHLVRAWRSYLKVQN